MADDGVVEITPEVRIPRTELRFQATRAGGPGGQHVNKTATRIELWWHPASSASLDDVTRARVVEGLASRLDGDGWLRLVSAGERSQLRNREAAVARLRALVATALRVRKARRKTRPGPAARAARLEAKRRRGETKARRRPVAPDD